MNEAYRIIVRGNVQGVGFRFSTRQKALSLGLCGWVKNKFDGSVEIHCEGTETMLRTLIKWLEDGGPSFSRIESIEKYKAHTKGYYADFLIEY